MSGVVLRCPNCGTTRGAPGECEACHEAQVRYQCTNHTPGRWLDEEACTQCGARFGGPDRPLAKPPAAVSTPAAPVRTPVAPPGRAHAPGPVPAAPARPRGAASPAIRPATGAGTAGRRDRSPPIEDADDGDDGDDVDPRAAHSTARVRTVPPEVASGTGVAPIVRGFGGCLMRLVLLAVLLFLALVSSVFVFGTSLLQGF